MSTLKHFYQNHKLMIQIGGTILLLPFLLPIVTVLIEILFDSGQIIGDYIRRITEIGIC